MKLHLIYAFVFIISHTIYAPVIEIIGQITAFDPRKKNILITIQKIIDTKSDPNIPLAEDHTPLWYSVLYGEYELSQKLLQLGANPDFSSNSASWATPLLKSIHGGNIDILRLLLNYNANPNKLTSAGNTYLHWLCLSHNYLTDEQRINTAQLLLNYGAFTNVRSLSIDNFGLSILELARSKIPGTTLLALIENHSDVQKIL